MGAQALRSRRRSAAIPLAEYHQSKDELAGLPVTVAEKIPVTNTPNIFSYRSLRLRQEPGARAALHQGHQGRRRRRGRPRGRRRRGEVDHRQVRPRQQRLPRRAHLHLAHRHPHRRRRARSPASWPRSVDMSGGRRAHVGRAAGGRRQGGRARPLRPRAGPRRRRLHRQPARRRPGHGGAAASRSARTTRRRPCSCPSPTRPSRWRSTTTPPAPTCCPRFNTGLVIAASKMKRGYLFEIVDLDTKAQAVEAGAHPRDPEGARRQDGRARQGAAGEGHHAARARGPLRHRGADAAPRASSSRASGAATSSGEADQLGYVCSAERLHNIKTKKGFTYGGKDDPVLLAFAQGDWPAPGEITSPWAACPMVAGDCRGSHNLHILPMPINSQTSYWSGPILSRHHALVQHPHGPHRRHLRPVRARHAVGRGAPRRPPSSPSSSATRTASSSRPRCTRTSSSTRRAGRSAAPASSASSRSSRR